jgi:hypothetical protein
MNAYLPAGRFKVIPTGLNLHVVNNRFTVENLNLKPLSHQAIKP